MSARGVLRMFCISVTQWLIVATYNHQARPILHGRCNGRDQVTYLLRAMNPQPCLLPSDVMFSGDSLDCRCVVHLAWYQLLHFDVLHQLPHLGIFHNTAAGRSHLAVAALKLGLLL